MTKRQHLITCGATVAVSAALAAGAGDLTASMLLGVSIGSVLGWLAPVEGDSKTETQKDA